MRMSVARRSALLVLLINIKSLCNINIFFSQIIGTFRAAAVWLLQK